VVKIDLRAIFGSKSDVEAAIEASTVSKVINIAFVERHNGTDAIVMPGKFEKVTVFPKTGTYIMQ